MVLNCLVVDDEPLARNTIESYIGRLDFLKLTGSARNPLIAAAILDTQPIDLIFMDIKMPHSSGIEFIRGRQPFQPVILITAYPEFALEGFDIEALDYLVKPVSFERFKRAAEKAFAKITGSGHLRKLTDRPDFIYVKENQQYLKIYFDEILFVESMLNYVHFVTATGKHTVYSSLKNVEATLPADRFIRIHKSYLASIDKIDAIELNAVSVARQKLPLGKQYKAAAMELVGKHR
ncbi:MAG: LytR/AlgR family response regulator transcription factor [Mucilaginibacter sp.]